MTLLFFIFGTVILLLNYSKRSDKGCLLLLGHFLYIPLAYLIFDIFKGIKPIFGFIALSIIFIITIVFNLGIKESKLSKIIGITGVILGEIIPTILFLHWMLFEISFGYTDRTYTDFTPANTAAVLSDLHIKDNGTFTITSITDSREYFSVHIESSSDPEVFINELMDKEYYDTKTLYENVCADFEKTKQRNDFGIYDPDGTRADSVSESVYLPDYLKDQENIYSSNITHGRTEVTFDEKNNKCSIWASGDHLSRFSENAAAIIRGKTDTFEKKLDIILNDR